jgi:hypothetical protein
MYRRTLELTAEQRAELERVRDRAPQAYLREGAAALLKIAAGQAPYRVARHGLHRPRKPDTVYGWLAKYLAGGVAALRHQPRGHRGLSPPAARRRPGGGAAPT